MTKKRYIAPHFDNFDPRNAIKPLMMMMASCNVNTNTSHVVPHFNCFELRNAVGALTILSTSCGITTDGNGVTHHKGYFVPHFDSNSSKNTVVPLMIPLASHETDANTSGIT